MTPFDVHDLAEVAHDEGIHLMGSDYEDRPLFKSIKKNGKHDAVVHSTDLVARRCCLVFNETQFVILSLFDLYCKE